MTREEIDDYLADIDEPKRSTLESLRASIISIVPKAEQGLSYGAPAFRVNGKAVAGFASYKNHLSYLPHSGDVLAQLDQEALAGFEVSKGALKFPIDTPLPDALVAKLVAARLEEIGD